MEFVTKKKQKIDESTQQSTQLHSTDDADEKKRKSENKLTTEKQQASLLSFVSVSKDKDKNKGKGKEKEEADSSITSGLLSYLSDEGWKKALAAEFKKGYFQKILEFLEKEKQAAKQIFPPEPDIFAAFNMTPFDQIKVVIIGQDPYHDNNQAHGLCFSVKKGITPPPSLKNIYKELSSDIPGFVAPSHGYLEKWAKQGVLLLNASLTVEAHKANSHSNIGWQEFTDAVIRLINEQKKGVVFILWGGFAQKKGKIIDKNKHHIIAAAHPSPLSANKFFGCKVFSKTNDALKKSGQQAVDWTLPLTI